MSNPIYKIWMAKAAAPYFALAKEEQDRLLQQNEEARSEVGGKQLVACSTFWANERWQFFGVELFPDAQALQQHSQKVESLGWPNFLDSQSFLGVSDMPFTPVAAGAGGVYKLFLGKYTEAAYQLDEKARDQSMAQLEAPMKEAGGTSMIIGDIISSEESLFFGCEHYPSLDAVIAYRKKLNELEWFRYIQAEILLGTPVA